MIAKRAIAFDIGNKRIGVAISDPFNEYAMPCETYVRTRNIDADASALAKLAKDKGVGVIVCGMPFHYDGSEGIQTARTREFIEYLREKTDLPIELEDERFTTMQARETQIQGGIKCADRKKTIDSIAASYILESYLAREKITFNFGFVHSGAIRDIGSIFDNMKNGNYSLTSTWEKRGDSWKDNLSALIDQYLKMEEADA
jgi:putative Holliday junction resolvase